MTAIRVIVRRIAFRLENRCGFADGAPRGMERGGQYRG